MTPKKKSVPIHPGEILLEEFMQPLGLSQTRLSLDLGVSPRRINEIVHGKREPHRRYRLEIERLLWHVGGILAGAPSRL
jgi:antitoxin HigA-1